MALVLVVSLVLFVAVLSISVFSGVLELDAGMALVAMLVIVTIAVFGDGLRAESATVKFSRSLLDHRPTRHWA